VNDKRSDRYGSSIERNGSRKHHICFADDRPNGKTSGVILAKVYNVESFKEYNKLDGGNATKEIMTSKGKTKFVEDEE
jgi:hypothetical protein